MKIPKTHSGQQTFGNFGWLGREKERQARDILFNAGLMLTFKQWQDIEDDIDFVEVFNFPFDEGFAFWPITSKVAGDGFGEDEQSVGNCVPYGSVLANIDRMCIELLVFGEAESFFAPFIPYSYGAGRVYIGGDTSTSDGSLGSWQIAADMKYGLLPCDIANVPIRHTNDIQGSADTNHKWMRTRSVLDQFQPYAKPLTVGEGASIESFDELKIAVCDKKEPVTIASDWGFVSTGLDSKYGIVVHKPGGSWSHQMHVRAVFAIKGQWFVYIGNQWGFDAHPKVAEGFALGGFVITAETFDRWVKEAECFVRGALNGRVFKPNFSFL